MTTPAQAKRIVMLDDALSGIADVLKEMKRRKPAEHYSRRVLRIEISDECDSGGTCDAGIEIDLDTGDLLLPMVKRLIREQLHALGAKP